MLAMPSWARCFAVVAIVASPAGVRADTPRSLTEAAFLAEAHAAAPTRAVGEAQLAAATAAVSVARLRPNPSLAWEHDDLPGTSRLDRLAIAVPIDLSARRTARIRAATHEARAIGAETDARARAWAASAGRAYWHAAATRQIRIALEEARGPVAALAAEIATQAQAGAASGYDADRVALELAILDDELAGARGAEQAAAAAMAAWLDSDTAVAAADPLTLPARPGPTTVAPEVGAAAGARAEARAAEAVEARAAARPWAGLEVQAGVLYDRSGDERALGFTVGVAAPLPIFDGGGARARRAEADAIAARAEAVAARQAATRAAAPARVALIAAIERAETHRAGATTLSARLIASVEVAYREGDRSLLELLDAHRARRAAAIHQLELLHAARVAALDLSAALQGVP